MTQPADSPPDLCLHRSEERREDGRYLIYYTVTLADESETPAPGSPGEGAGGGVSPCPN